MSSAVRSFTKIYERSFEISWNFYKKGINYACTEFATYFLDVSEKVLYALEVAERKNTMLSSFCNFQGYFHKNSD